MRLLQIAWKVILQSVNKQKYPNWLPSRNKRGEMLNMAKFVKTYNISGSSNPKSWIGNIGIKIDFSWTWKEKRKNASEHVARVIRNTLGLGYLKQYTIDGEQAANVRNALILLHEVYRQSYLNLRRVSTPTRPLSFKNGLDETQKLATLSSNIPRSNGNNLLNTCRTPSKPSNMKNGANNPPRENNTTSLIFTSKVILTCA